MSVIIRQVGQRIFIITENQKNTIFENYEIYTLIKRWHLINTKSLITNKNVQYECLFENSLMMNNSNIICGFFIANTFVKYGRNIIKSNLKKQFKKSNAIYNKYENNEI